MTVQECRESRHRHGQ